MASSCGAERYGFVKDGHRRDEAASHLPCSVTPLVSDAE